MAFYTTNQLIRSVKSGMKKAIIKEQEKVFKVLDEFIDKFYSSYTPEMYERTFQLYRSLVKSDVQSSGNGFIAYVYFDLSSLSYSTGAKPNGSQVVSAAAHGGHGAEVLLVVEGSVGIWDDPLAVISPKIYNSLKQSLIDNGIPIR